MIPIAIHALISCYPLSVILRGSVEDCSRRSPERVFLYRAVDYDICLREHPSKLRLRVALASAFTGRSRSSNAIVLHARWEIRVD